MKTEFNLEKLRKHYYGDMRIKIVGKAPKNKPYVLIDGNIPDVSPYAIKDKDLERLAVNILKAIKSKKLK